RERVEVPYEADGLGERPWLLRGHGLWLEPALHLREACRRQPRRRVGIGRVVPRPLPAVEIRRERLLAGDRVGGVTERVDVAAPTALGEQPAARLERAVDRREQRVVV